jgi:hypothetical protein
MSTYTVSASAVIPASAASCYDVIADYHVGHPAIVPPRAFGPLIVEAGGVGAGTRIRFTMRALGQVRTVSGVVTEPVPGRTLVETYDGTGVVTSFFVDPRGEMECEVTITTRMPSPRGIRGAIERWLTRLFLERLYREELGRLSDYVRGGIALRRTPQTA